MASAHNTFLFRDYRIAAATSGRSKYGHTFGGPHDRRVLACGAFLAGAACTYLVLRALDSQHGELALIIGAILGSQVGALLHHRQPGASPSGSAKAQLGLALAVVAVAFSLCLQLLMNWLEVPEVSIPIAAIGCFCFPFVLFRIVWRSLEEARKKHSEKAEPPTAPYRPPE